MNQKKNKNNTSVILQCLIDKLEKLDSDSIKRLMSGEKLGLTLFLVYDEK